MEALWQSVERWWGKHKAKEIPKAQTLRLELRTPIEQLAALAVLKEDEERSRFHFLKTKTPATTSPKASTYPSSCSSPTWKQKKKSNASKKNNRGYSPTPESDT